MLDLVSRDRSADAADYGCGRLAAAAPDLVTDQAEKAFDRYLTKDLVLAYMNAVAAGDLKTTVSV